MTDFNDWCNCLQVAVSKAKAMFQKLLWLFIRCDIIAARPLRVRTLLSLEISLCVCVCVCVCVSFVAGIPYISVSVSLSLCLCPLSRLCLRLRLPPSPPPPPPLSTSFLRFGHVKNIFVWILVILVMLCLLCNFFLPTGYRSQWSKSTRSRKPKPLNTLERSHRGWIGYEWPLRAMLCAARLEISPESNSLQTLQKSFGWDYKPRSPVKCRPIGMLTERSRTPQRSSV